MTLPEQAAPVFITGATGFVGGQVAKLLIEAGQRVRALYRTRPGNPLLGGCDIQWVPGDLTNPDSLLGAMHGCRWLYHVAADYRLWARNPRELYRNNVLGTEHILRAAGRLGLEKIVYTSSVGVLGIGVNDSPADENTPVGLRSMIGHYKRSKYLAEQKVMQQVAAGLPVTLVHPSTPVGPGDWKPTPTGKIIVDFLNGRMPAYLDTGLNLVHVRDVAAGHLLAMSKGRIGRRYILGNRNLSLQDLLHRLAAITGLPAPRIRLPYRPVWLLACVNQVFSNLTGIAPMVPLEGVKMARHRMYFDVSRAVGELGLPQTPLDQALAEAVRWFDENGYIARERT